MNRAVRRTILFEKRADYDAFVRLVCTSLRIFRIKIIAYCLMPNHWHFVVMCDRIEEVSKWMHWVAGTHANRWNRAHRTRGRGAVYQGRFKAVPVQRNRSIVRVCRYVERNALRKGLVQKAEAWRWSSLFSTVHDCDIIPLSPWPIAKPSDWCAIVNAADGEVDLDEIRTMLRRNWPIGKPEWRAAVAPFVGLTLRDPGRPKKRH